MPRQICFFREIPAWALLNYDGLCFWSNEYGNTPQTTLPTENRNPPQLQHLYIDRPSVTLPLKEPIGSAVKVYEGSFAHSDVMDALRPDWSRAISLIDT